MQTQILARTFPSTRRQVALGTDGSSHHTRACDHGGQAYSGNRGQEPKNEVA